MQEPDPKTEAQTGTAALYRAHFDSVWRALRRLGVPSGALDDATQDVFLVVHRRLDEFEGRSSPRTWILGIAVRVARWHRRKAARATKESQFVGPVEPVAGPAELVEQREAMRLVYTVLGQLREAHREVMVLADIEDLEAPEIARVLGIPENTVYSRLRQARKRFEASLARARARDEWRVRWTS